MNVKDKVLQTRISEKLLERFDIALKHEGISRSDFVIQAIREYVNETERKTK